MLLLFISYGQQKGLLGAYFMAVFIESSCFNRCIELLHGNVGQWNQIVKELHIYGQSCLYEDKLNFYGAISLFILFPYKFYLIHPQRPHFRSIPLDLSSVTIKVVAQCFESVLDAQTSQSDMKNIE